MIAAAVDSPSAVHDYLHDFARNADLQILDLRSAEAFAERRLPRSHNIPITALQQRLFELPPRGQEASKERTMCLLVPSPSSTGTDWATWFAEHEWHHRIVFCDTEELWTAAREQNVLCTSPPTERTLLFNPCPLLAQKAPFIEQQLQASQITARTCLDVGAILRHPPTSQSKCKTA
jgi:hypothetical protein